MILCLCPNPSIDIYIWIDAISPGKVNRASREEHYPGGKGLHVALACAELGEEVTIAGFWGGPTGDWIRKECMKKNVRSIGIEVKEWSRNCQSFKSENEYNETEILGVGPKICNQDQQALYRLLEMSISTASCISMSGSWPRGSSDDAYARLISLCNSQGKAVFLDCSGRQLGEALTRKPYLVHLNKSEALIEFGISEPLAPGNELCK